MTTDPITRIPADATELCCDPARYDRGECAGAECPYLPAPAPAQAVACAGKRDGLLRAAEIASAQSAREEAHKASVYLNRYRRDAHARMVACKELEAAIRAEADAFPAERTQGESEDAAFVERMVKTVGYNPDGKVVVSSSLDRVDQARLITLARRGATRPTPNAGDVEARIAAEPITLADAHAANARGVLLRHGMRLLYEAVCGRLEHQDHMPLEWFERQGFKNWRPWFEAAMRDVAAQAAGAAWKKALDVQATARTSSPSPARPAPQPAAVPAGDAS